MNAYSETTDPRDLRRLRRRPLGRYRYVRLRWRLLFAVIDFLGGAVFGAARAARRWVLGPAPNPPDPPHDPKVVLLVQLDHLGDAIISTGMLPALRKRYPAASIEVLAGSWNREVFESVPEVDCVHVSHVNRFARGRLGRFLWIPAMLWWGLALRRRKVDLGIDVRGDFPVAVILRLCGARRRLGWDCGGGGFLLTDTADFVPHRPEVESRRALLAKLGIRPPGTGACRPRFQPTTDARREIVRRLAREKPPAPLPLVPKLQLGNLWSQSSTSRLGEAGASHRRVPKLQLGNEERKPVPFFGPLVVLHVGAGTRAKRWPVEHWRELLGRILVGCGAQVVLVGSRRDRIIAAEILGDRPWPGVIDWTGRLTVRELAALLQQADVMVGADSGPAHLAAAVATPVVVLFSGTNRPRQWRPCGERVTVVRHAVGCSPCHRERCPMADHPCMTRLSARRVAAEVQSALRSPPADRFHRITPPGTASEYITTSQLPARRPDKKTV